MALFFSAKVLCSRAFYKTTMAAIATLAPHLVKVRVVEGSEHIKLILDDCWGLNRTLKLTRGREDKLYKTLERIVLKTQYAKHGSTKAMKKHRRKQQDGEETSDAVPIEVRLYDPSGELVKADTPNILAWEEGGVLVVNSIRYDVHVNIPTILSIQLPSLAMSDCPIIPEVTLEFTDFYLCRWEWFRCAPGLSDSDPTPNPSHLERVGTSHSYWPSDADCGRRLLLCCTPISTTGKIGDRVTALSAVVVQSPKDTPITRRHLLTPARLAEPGAFRVVSYNTLASVFTSTEHAHNELYSYCDPTALKNEYREGRLAHEVVGYNADVLCLQEVGTDTYTTFLLPALRDKGYDGCHMEKPGSINEGEAIFYDTSRYNLIAWDNIPLREFLQTDPSCSELLVGLAPTPSYLADISSKSSIVTSVVLQSSVRPDRYLLVANTHLYYHPRGDHVRLAQSVVLVNFLRTKLEKYSALLGDAGKLAMVLCGDFNSCPCIAAYHYLVDGFVSREHRDWKGYRLKGMPPPCDCVKVNDGDVLVSKAKKMLEMEAEEELYVPLEGSAVDGFQGMELRHDLCLQNVTGTEHCTNFTSSFKAVLDYIMIGSAHLEVERVVPLPPVSELAEFVALPSVYFPSDHIALVADIKWK